jgi:hypothetical protein
MIIHPGQDKEVNRLLEGVHNGEFAKPAFQRKFKWKPNQVSELLASISFDYFSGLLLFWEINDDTEKEVTFEPLEGAKKSDHVNFAILDGQQRLSSLYYAIYNPDTTFPNTSSYYVFYLNIDRRYNNDIDNSITFEHDKKHTSIDTLKAKKDKFINELKFPLALLSDKDFKEKEWKYWIKGYAKKLLAKYPAENVEDEQMATLDLGTDVREFIFGILDYKFNTHVLEKTKEMKDVSIMFARLNQKGLKLSMFDLMNAYLYKHGIELKKSYDDEVEEPLNKIRGIDEYLLKFMALVKREYSSPTYVYSLIPEQKDVQRVNGKKVVNIPIKSREEFLKLWKDAIKYSETARRKIQNVSDTDKHFGAIKRDFIPNTTLIPVLAAVLKIYKDEYKDKVPEREFDRIVSKWYWSAVFSQEYSGSSDTVMSKDFRELKAWLKSGDPDNIQRLKPDKLQGIIDELDLENYKKGTSVYNAIISLIALSGGPDFYERTSPGSVDYNSKRVNDHHIFPSKIEGLDKDKSTKFSSTKDNILNRTLLFDQTNIKISNKKPSVYVKEMQDKMGGDYSRLEDLMAKHFISKLGLEYMRDDDYDNFIKERETTIKEGIKSRLPS